MIENKVCILKFRVTESHRDALKTQAQNKKVKLSALLRQMTNTQNNTAA